MLSALIRQSCIVGAWKPLQFKIFGNSITHMSFVDEIVIFGEASLDNVQTTLSVDEHFCLCSGQRINFKRSLVICADNLDSNVVASLIKNARSAAPFQKVYLQMKNKVQNWKFRTLSQAGRLVMLKSVLLALPTYLMSCYEFPKTILSQLTKLL